ncbi:MAG: ABC transporter permease [Chthoniobacterales bacterium]
MHELRYALRTLLKSPGFSFVAIVTLALAIGANTSLFSLIKGAYFDGLPYPHAREILTIDAENPTSGQTDLPLSGPEFVAIAEQSRTLVRPTALIGTSFNLTGEGDAVRFRGLRASANFFAMVGVQPMLGRLFADEEQRPGNERVVVVSYAFWQRALGGAANVIGRDVQLNDIAYRVIGVMPPRFRYGDNDLWVPLALDLARQDRASRNIYAHARLAPGTDVRVANAELATIARRVEADLGPAVAASPGWSFKATPLIDGVLRDVKSALAILLGAVGCVLLIACANISNLQLARNVVREKEIAIRLALGATRSDIVRQLLLESGLLALIGGGAGILLACWSLGPLLRLVPFSFIPIEAEVKVDQTVLLATFALTFLTAILFGLLPAWKASRPALENSLKDGRRSAGDARHRRMQRVLVVSQVALTFVLLIASALMTKSFARLQRADPGFDPARLFKLELALPASRYSAATAVRGFYDELVTEVRQLPGVESASAARVLPVATFPMRASISIDGTSADGAFAEDRQIMPRYFETLNVSLLRGRDLSERDNENAAPVAIVNEAFVAKYFPTRDPLGRRVRVENSGSKSSWLTIVGVVKDVHQFRISDAPLPEIYRPHAQAPDASRRMALVIRSPLDQASLLRSVRELVRARDPGVPIFDAEPMQQVIAQSYGGQKLAVSLLGVFGAFALVLTLLGIYGVIAYFVAQRTGEIGIRMALGAQRHHVLQLIVGQGSSMICIGLLIGTACAIAATRLLRSLLFQVSASDLSIYIMVGASLAIAALAASFFPARAAMRLNPVEALRHD